MTTDPKQTANLEEYHGICDAAALFEKIAAGPIKPSVLCEQDPTDRANRVITIRLRVGGNDVPSHTRKGHSYVMDDVAASIVAFLNGRMPDLRDVISSAAGASKLAAARDLQVEAAGIIAAANPAD